MSRRSVVLNEYAIVISLVSILSLNAMEEYHEDHDMHQEPPAVTQPSAAGPQVPATASTSQPLVWQDQPGSTKAPGEGITTVNEARGNWFFKNQIGKDARKLNVDIHKKVAAVQPLQEKYLKDREAVDAALNAFNTEYGFHGGEIDARLDILIDQVTKLEETQSAHDAEEVALLEDLKKKKTEVEALKKDFQDLQDLENALSQSLAIMSSAITKVVSYEDQASTHYDEIFEVLNDQTAEELFKKMKVLFDNIVVIETYLTGEFSTYFKNTSQKIIDQIEVIKKHIIDLKQQGIALGQKMRELQAKEDEEFKLKDKEEQEKKAHLKAKAERTWLSPIFDAISWTWTTARDAVYWVFSKIGSLFSWMFTSKSEKIAKKAVQEAPSEPALEPEFEPEVETPAVSNVPVVSEPTPHAEPQTTPSGAQPNVIPVPPIPATHEEVLPQNTVPAQMMPTQVAPVTNMPTSQVSPVPGPMQPTVETQVPPVTEVHEGAPVTQQAPTPLPLVTPAPETAHA